jgi:23S rRNA pseudouridine1911/1915/1917 synthase
MTKNNNHIHILYEDNHILAVVKPCNMLTQGDRTKDPDLVSILKEDLKKRYQKPGNVFLGIVHRLDRPVGGVIVFAKTSKAASRISLQIRNHEFKKFYLAVVRGSFPNSCGTMEHYLLKDHKTNTVRIVSEKEPAKYTKKTMGANDSKENEGAKKAVLNYSLIERRQIKKRQKISLVKVDLITGRPHQIRAQFAYSGWPVLGDQKYGLRHQQNGKNESKQRADTIKHNIALWSSRITFLHPTKKEKLDFNANPPDIYPWHLFDKG